jgi:2-polyprenyl-3-methyl-5-hydroxy-6-metoxy-1,4-benzoquinol methylase
MTRDPSQDPAPGAAFDAYQDTYQQAIQGAIDFLGQSHDFFIEAKAEVTANLISERCGDIRQTKILDVGCGTGVFSGCMARRGVQVHGIDVAEKVVERARDAVPSGSFSTYDGQHIPHPDDEFDVVIAVNVFHHIQPGMRDTLLADMRRVTRRGGVTMLMEHNPYNPLTLRAVRRCAFDHDAVLLKRSEAMARLRRAGFTDVYSRYIIFVPFDGFMHRWTQRWLGRWPLGAQYFALGCKD